MKHLRARIQDAVVRNGVLQDVIELDYALSYILAGLDSCGVLRNSLVLKGGTALKKLFFGDYRFSVDLDFSTIAAPSGGKLEQTIRKAIEEAKTLLSVHGAFTLIVERYTERRPHPHGQEAFIIRLQFPWHPEPLCRVKLEISHDEPVLLEPARRSLIHGYGEDLPASFKCYRLEEIVVEKLRTLLQTHERLVRRGWIRPRARDYYDLWRVLRVYGDELERALLPSLLDRKCEHRGVAFRSPDDFFSNRLVSEARSSWNRGVVPFAPNAPSCDEVLGELKPLVHALLPGLSTTAPG